MIKYPVVFIIFKRPDTTEKVLTAIRQAKPEKLFVIADGPRTERTGEAEQCKATRAIIERVDWNCEVITNYSEVNLGCAKRVSSGLDWVFEQVEEAIILEDDCVPHPTFFPFCEELLDKYRYDTRIASISGQNVQFGRKRTNYSYYFSRYNHCWGWASWRRAWQHFDFQMKLWTEVKENKLLENILDTSQEVDMWTDTLDSTYCGHLDSWATKWTLACWLQSGLCILPNVNLISNIGFGTDSTHFTSDQLSPYENIPTETIDFPLKHPPFVFQNFQADSFTQKTLFKQAQIQMLKQKINRLLKGLKNFL